MTQLRTPTRIGSYLDKKFRSEVARLADKSSMPISRINESTLLDSSHYTVLVDASAGGVSIHLPPAARARNRIYNIKKIDSTTNIVNINPYDVETIDGGTAIASNTQWESFSIHCSGEAWYLV